jgi:hypothetical protein
MATLTTQTITRSGTTPTYAAATGGGDAMACGTDMFLHVKNASGGAITVTIAIPAGATGYPQAAYTNTVVSVPATTGDKMIGPIVAPLYADPTTGLATITYSGVTSLTVAALNLQEP